MRRRCEEVERGNFLPRSFPAPFQEILKRGFGHSRNVGCSFPAHFRDRPPCGRSLPRAVYDLPSGKFARLPLRVLLGMKNCRTSAREAYTIRRGAISVFAQDAPRTAHPLRAQVGMKNCRTSAREAYTIRHGAISVFAQDAPRTARPLREQVGMKNCRTSAREAYLIR